MINNVFQLAVEIFSYNATSNKKKQKQKTKKTTKVQVCGMALPYNFRKCVSKTSTINVTKNPRI